MVFRKSGFPALSNAYTMCDTLAFSLKYNIPFAENPIIVGSLNIMACGLAVWFPITPLTKSHDHREFHVSARFPASGSVITPFTTEVVMDSSDGRMLFNRLKHDAPMFTMLRFRDSAR